MTLSLIQAVLIAFGIGMEALIAAFSILFIGKTGIREVVIVKSPIRLISELFSCDFCLSFWTNLFYATIIFLVFGCWIAFLFPIFAAPITRHLI